MGIQKGATNMAYQFNLEELQSIMDVCTQEEYKISVIAGYQTGNNAIMVSLEKGSQYGDMHMKFSAHGATVKDAFNKAYANFPTNPVNGRWASARLEAPKPENESVDGVFTELPSTPPKKDMDDDIPF